MECEHCGTPQDPSIGSGCDCARIIELEAERNELRERLGVVKGIAVAASDGASYSEAQAIELLIELLTGPLPPCPECDELRAEVKWLGGLLEEMADISYDHNLTNREVVKLMDDVLAKRPRPDIGKGEG